ncbi:hypothetical protein SCARD494_02172 [Seiridium cardinale]
MRAPGYTRGLDPTAHERTCHAPPLVVGCGTTSTTTWLALRWEGAETSNVPGYVPYYGFGVRSRPADWEKMTNFQWGGIQDENEQQMQVFHLDSVARYVGIYHKTLVKRPFQAGAE